VDAHILARYGVTMDLPAQVRPEPERLELRDLMERRDQLVEMRKSARIRLAQPHAGCSSPSRPPSGTTKHSSFDNQQHSCAGFCRGYAVAC
ncbi:hypothetical protein ABK249_33165, partial [Neorhizobium sp. Rsf11]